MKKAKSTLTVNGDNTGLERAGFTDPSQRDRQLLIKAIQYELHDPTLEIRQSDMDFSKIKNSKCRFGVFDNFLELTCVVRYLEKRDKLDQFAQSIGQAVEELKA